MVLNSKNSFFKGRWPVDTVEKENKQGELFEFKVKVKDFEGPFDLLLHLVEDKEIEIWDVNISAITTDYLSYLHKMHELDLNVAGEFMVMAAILIELKSKMLLPNNSNADSESIIEAEEERRRLLEKLIEYKAFKNLTQKLIEKEDRFKYVFTREHLNKKILDSFPIEKVINIKNASLENLTRCFNRVWQDFELRVITHKIEHVSDHIFSVKSKIYDIFSKLRTSSASMMFTEFFHDVSSRYEIIATFLALLELMREGLILAVQKDLFDDIEIVIKANISEQELSTALENVDEYNSVQELGADGTLVKENEVVAEQQDLLSEQEEDAE